jgi:hypothetical protein
MPGHQNSRIAKRRALIKKAVVVLVIGFLVGIAVGNGAAIHQPYVMAVLKH